jgi:carbamoyltransferase
MAKPFCGGLHLLLYTHVDARAAAHDVGLRHDHNITTWRKTGRRIDLPRHWEFERFSGLKHHALSFPDAGAAKAFIPDRLGEMGVSFGDVKPAAGTPGLEDPRDVSADLSDADWPCHDLCRLHSSMLLDTDAFARGSKPSRALNCGLDNVLDGEGHAKPHCPGAVEAFRVARPAPL